MSGLAIGVGFAWSRGFAEGVSGVSDWGNKGSVIKGDVDVAISCGGVQTVVQSLALNEV